MNDNTEKISELQVLQGTSNFIQDSLDFDKSIQMLKDKIRELFNLKNVNFLFGSGTSSGAISTMSKLFSTLEFEDEVMQDEFDCIVAKVGENLEKCLNVMYAARSHYQGLKTEDKEAAKSIADSLALYEGMIEKIEDHIYTSINIGFDKEKEKEVLEYYKTFYQKLALRTKDNSRIRVFTTNNDLFSEMALDALNIHYINGFSGGIHRFFNPAIFNYTWSKRMDTSIDKYEPVENMVYLYKIHGSVNWVETDNFSNNYFEIEEIAPSKEKPDNTPVLIYPTPTKQDKSLGSPYVDMFREFQNKLLEPHSVLFVIGYSFSDRHVNDIIYRALATNSTINVVIFGTKPEEKERKNKPIFFINDNRIFTVNGTYYDEKGEAHRVHYFDYIVNNLLPNLDTFRQEDEMLLKFVSELNKNKKNDEDR
ncbi:MAG: SIR2 family protein [Bacteroidales bacterium]|nr:SIR2 family protein [Bacteroidales bacterium]